MKEDSSITFRRFPVSEDVFVKYFDGIKERPILEVHDGESFYNTICEHISSNIVKGDSSYHMQHARHANELTGELAVSKAEFVIGLGFFSFKDFDGNTLYALHEQVGDFVGTDCGVQCHVHLVLFGQQGATASSLEEFCTEVLRRAEKSEPGTFNLFAWHSNHRYWKSRGIRSARPLESVIISHEQMATLMEDMDTFEKHETRALYRKHGIPYRRSYLFHGVPGTGKSSLIQALAGHYKRNVCFLQPTDKNITDEDLQEAMQDAPSHSIIVIEDIDALFGKDRSKKISDSHITFSGLLNALDGLASSEGQIIVITTNFREQLDDALIREGRVDVHLEFTYMGQSEAERMFLAFYPDASEDIVSAFGSKLFVELKKNEMTLIPAALQQFFIKNIRTDAANAALNYQEVVDQIRTRQQQSSADVACAEDADADDASETEPEPQSSAKQTLDFHFHLHQHGKE